MWIFHCTAYGRWITLCIVFYTAIKSCDAVMFLRPFSNSFVRPYGIFRDFQLHRILIALPLKISFILSFTNNPWQLNWEQIVSTHWSTSLSEQFLEIWIPSVPLSCPNSITFNPLSPGSSNTFTSIPISEYYLLFRNVWIYILTRRCHPLSCHFLKKKMISW